ncbi:hypothetical protein RDWZM_001843 [Blomia tropicalis]|uniref:MH2 domain-containing protein n=1 Tax=Blomia tropicalis TaxID=40697 RepID=A0A9Q0RPC6_BLOTA|nr:hypothetical protein RDWZM_001843 [Blomia tropicalis]
MASQLLIGEWSVNSHCNDHILEILNKWEQIDDEIWAKLICMERNRRVAKAYARAPILTINGSEDGFDGYRIGMNGFDNPLRDPKTDVVKHHIGDGVKIRMDDDGNILIKRLAKSNVYIKGWQMDPNTNAESSTSVSNEIIRNNGLLEFNKAVRLFDMKKFQTNMNRELRRAYPDRRKLENQCICCISFVKDASDMLDLPVWVMVINIVAMDMLKSKLPPTISKRQSVPNLVSMFDRQKSTISEEDPYSIPGNNSTSSGSRSSGHYVTTGQIVSDRSPPNGKSSSSNGSNEPKPPKLPPRDFERKQKQSKSSMLSKKNKNQTSKDVENHYGLLGPNANSRQFDDPYYSGFSARVPNYAKRQTSLPMPNQVPFKSNGVYNTNDVFHARKVPSSGFLNSFLKTPNVIHSRTASYQSYYGSLGKIRICESDPYTASSEGGPNDDSLVAYGDSTYGRIGMVPRFDHQSNKISSNGNKRNLSAPIPWMYRSAYNDDHYGAWDD